MKLSEKLARQLAEKRDKVNVLLEKTDPTEADIKEADDLIGEIKTEDAAYKAQVEREAFKASNDEEIIRFKNTPVNGLNHPQQKDTTLEGFEKDGEVLVDMKSKKILEESGFNLKLKTLSDISTKSYRDAFYNYLAKKGVENLGNGDLKSLSVGTDSAGGFLVPADFLARMIEREPASPVLTNYVTQLMTNSDKLVMPKNTYSASDKYTTGVRVEWVEEESGSENEQNAKNFGTVSIPVHTAMFKHDLTNNIIEDGAMDIVGWLLGKFKETADLTKEDMIIIGSGIGQPAGILLNPGGANQPEVINSGSNTGYTYDGLVDLAYSLKARYTRNARFIFNRTSSGRALAKIKDADGRPLFASGTQDDGLANARPERLLGFGTSENDFMPDVAQNAVPMIFGDPKGYYLVNRVGFSIQVLKEVAAENNKVRYLGRMRFGGQVAEDWKLKLQRISA